MRDVSLVTKRHFRRSYHEGSPCDCPISSSRHTSETNRDNLKNSKWDPERWTHSCNTAGETNSKRGQQPWWLGAPTTPYNAILPSTRKALIEQLLFQVLSVRTQLVKASFPFWKLIDFPNKQSLLRHCIDTTIRLSAVRLLKHISLAGIYNTPPRFTQAISCQSGNCISWLRMVTTDKIFFFLPRHCLACSLFPCN